MMLMMLKDDDIFDGNKQNAMFFSHLSSACSTNAFEECLSVRGFALANSDKIDSNGAEHPVIILKAESLLQEGTLQLTTTCHQDCIWAVS